MDTPLEQLLEQILFFGASDYNLYDHTIDKDNWYIHVDETEIQSLLSALLALKVPLPELPYKVNKALNELYPLYLELEDANYHTLNKYLDQYYAITHHGKSRDELWDRE